MNETIENLCYVLAVWTSVVLLVIGPMAAIYGMVSVLSAALV